MPSVTLCHAWAGLPLDQVVGVGIGCGEQPGAESLVAGPATNVQPEAELG